MSSDATTPTYSKEEVTCERHWYVSKTEDIQLHHCTVGKGGRVKEKKTFLQEDNFTDVMVIFTLTRKTKLTG